MVACPGDIQTTLTEQTGIKGAITVEWVVQNSCLL